MTYSVPFPIPTSACRDTGSAPCIARDRGTSSTHCTDSRLFSTTNPPAKDVRPPNFRPCRTLGLAGATLPEPPLLRRGILKGERIPESPGRLRCIPHATTVSGDLRRCREEKGNPGRNALPGPCTGAGDVTPAPIGRGGSETLRAYRIRCGRKVQRLAARHPSPRVADPACAQRPCAPGSMPAHARRRQIRGGNNRRTKMFPARGRRDSCNRKFNQLTPTT